MPNRSVQVEGNRLKISPQVKKISAAQTTNVHGVGAEQCQHPIAERAQGEGQRHGVFTADAIGDRAEERPRERRSSRCRPPVPHSGSVAPNRMAVFDRPKSLAIGASCAVAIRPLDDTRTNMT